MSKVERTLPLISIVIPTFKRPDFLTKILGVVAEQVQCLSPGTVEVLIIDNDPDGSAKVTMPGPAFRYMSESKPGVVHARNHGVDEALGQYVLFLDDDEVPDPNWLSAFHAYAVSGAAICFGPVRADFVTSPPDDLTPVLAPMFSRIFDRQDGADITDLRAYLGTGNSMFDRVACFSNPLGSKPFDPRFNGGGEDVWLLRHLVEDCGKRLTWVADASVLEQVPSSRCTWDFIAKRKQLSGSLRVVVENGAPGPARFVRVAKWMAAGFVQVMVFGLLGFVLKSLGQPSAPLVLAKYHGGLGKLIWFTHPGAHSR